jgi:hypothetical protein
MCKIEGWKPGPPKGLFWIIVSQVSEKEAQRYGKCLLFVVEK